MPEDDKLAWSILDYDPNNCVKSLICGGLIHAEDPA